MTWSGCRGHLKLARSWWTSDGNGAYATQACTGDRTAALSLACRLFSRAVPDRAQDQPLANRACAASLCTRFRHFQRLGRSDRICPRTLDRFISPAVFRHDISAVVSQEPAGRLHLDRHPAGDRLSLRIWHRAFSTRRSAASGDGCRAPVLDVISDTRLCLDQYSATRWIAKRCADETAYHRRADDLAIIRQRGLYRHGLFLSAVHGAATLRRAREDGRAPAGGGR